jgi:DNA-binding GntR family transcriptional regulator
MLDEPVERQRLSDIAYDRLRTAIITGELQPGERVRDADLSARIGISRTPVREALVRLTDAGLIEAKPNAHTRVSDLSREDVEHTLAVLQAMDQLAVQTGVPRLTATDLVAMRTAHEAFSEAVDREDPVAALAADDLFHGTLMAAAANPVLIRLVDQIHPTVHRVLHRKFSTLLGGRNTVEHHAHLLELCSEGDAEQAATLSAEHWRHLGGLIGDLFERSELV